MPYIESETKGNIREIRNSAELVFNGFTNEPFQYEVSKEHFQWLLEQAEKVQKIEYEIENSDMGTAVENIIEIIND